MNKTAIFSCNHCGKEFPRYLSQASKNKSGKQYCSSICADTANHDGYIVICKTCNKTFYISQRHFERSPIHYCSYQCSGIDRRSNLSEKSCSVCGKIMYLRPSELSKKCCSRKCLGEYQKTNQPSICLNCKGMFYRRASKGNAYFCCRACQRKYGFQTSKTWIEKFVEDILVEIRIAYTYQHNVGNFFYDLAIPNKNLLIECDGDYWHSLPDVQKRDRRKNAVARIFGYKLLRLSESQIKNNPQYCRDTILQFVSA